MALIKPGIKGATLEVQAPGMLRLEIPLGLRTRKPHRRCKPRSGTTPCWPTIATP
jgi:hypothetical protein